jgi:hypothetical protein
MRSVLGLALIVGGFAFSLYVGVWLLFIGGIVDVINEVKAAGAVDAMVIALGATKTVFAGVVGWLAGLVPIIVGFVILDD